MPKQDDANVYRANILENKAIIFDMDGVLVDSQPLHFRVDTKVLAECGVAAGPADVARYAGVSILDKWTSYKLDFGLLEDVSRLGSLHAAMMMEIFRDTNLDPIDGIPELLSLVRGLGYKTAVASSSTMELIELVIEKSGLSKYFDALVTGEDVGRGKPAPDVFLKASGVLDVLPRNCVVVEDSANGVLAAYNAGMRCIGFRNPNSGEQDLGKADWVLERFREVTEEKLKNFVM